MMKIIVPFAVEECRSTGIVARMQMSDVSVVLGRQVNRAVETEVSDGPGDLLEDRFIGLVVDLIDGIEPQPIEAVFVEPVERVLDEELPDGRRSNAIAAPHGVWRSS